MGEAKIEWRIDGKTQRSLLAQVEKAEAAHLRSTRVTASALAGGAAFRASAAAGVLAKVGPQSCIAFSNVTSNSC